MQIAHKIELNPNNKQKTYFKKACGVSRFPWTREVTKYAAQQPFLQLQESWNRYFKVKGAGKPRFKKKNLSTDSFYIGG